MLWGRLWAERPGGLVKVQRIKQKQQNREEYLFSSKTMSGGIQRKLLKIVLESKINRESVGCFHLIPHNPAELWAVFQGME